MYDIEKDVENVAKAYNEMVDELGDQAMLKYCHEVPMRAALNASAAVKSHQLLVDALEDIINQADNLNDIWDIRNTAEAALKAARGE